MNDVKDLRLLLLFPWKNVSAKIAVCSEVSGRNYLRVARALLIHTYQANVVTFTASYSLIIISMKTQSFNFSKTFFDRASDNVTLDH